VSWWHGALSTNNRMVFFVSSFFYIIFVNILHIFYWSPMLFYWDVNQKTVTDWKSKIPNLCEGYDHGDIFNMDETGLFYKDTTKNTFHLKGQDCAGGKRCIGFIKTSMLSGLSNYQRLHFFLLTYLHIIKQLFFPYNVFLLHNPALSDEMYSL
jgi:hypothetical protein